MTTTVPSRLLAVAAFALAVLAMHLPARAQVSGAGIVGAGQSYDWQHGPRRVDLMDQAHIDLPADKAFLGRTQAQQLLRAMGNPNADDVVGLVSGADGDWLIVLRFEKSGYIRETDTRSLDFDGLLEAVRNGTGASNQQRRSQGAPELEILGWLEQPSYDPQLHRLQWGIAIRRLGEVGTDDAAINFNTYLLGREGYFTLNLATSLQLIDKNRPHASQLVSAFEFENGKRYADHAGQSEPMASFGLSALISNGIDGKKPAKAPVERGFFATNARVLLIALGGIVLLAVGGAAGWYWMRKRSAASAAPLPEDAAVVEPADEPAGEPK